MRLIFVVVEGVVDSRDDGDIWMMRVTFESLLAHFGEGFFTGVMGVVVEEGVVLVEDDLLDCAGGHARTNKIIVN
jgi:hypothetical protein